MSRKDPFEDELRKRRSKEGPGRSRGRGWYWGGYWVGGGNLRDDLTVVGDREDGDHMGDQFGGGFEGGGGDGGGAI
jgi:hypothetical protein